MADDNTEQAEYWGASPSGAKWLTFEDRLDAAFAPVLDLVLDRAALGPGDRVLDIGCGTGASLIAAAQRVGPTGHVTGADISQQLVARAIDRVAAHGLEHIDIRLEDAQTATFPEQSYDALISRFGVMFFSDTVAAFANMAKALKPGATLTFAAWGPLGGNPWFKLPHLVAVERLGAMPKSDRNAPGPLAFHDAARISALLADAGLDHISVDAVDMRLTPPGTRAEAADLMTNVGPAARVMAHHSGTAADARAIAATVAAEIEAFEQDGAVLLPALINIYQARVPA